MQEEQRYHKNLAVHHQEIRQLHHDMNNHLLILYNALSQKDIEKATHYVEDQLQILEHNRTIYSDYALLDTVFFYKKQAANQQETKCTIYSELDSKLIFPESFLNDYALIISNCLDNALEATAKILEKEKRWIKVSMYNDDSYIYFQMENSMAENISFSKFEIPRTTKKDSYLHGLGLKNVKNLVAFYQGELLLDCKDSIFSVGLMVRYQDVVNKTDN